MPADWEIVPFERRPNRVYILAKTARYFKDSWFPLDFFERAYKELEPEFPGLEFVGGWKTAGPDAYDKVPKFFKNLGPMTPDAFDEQLKLAKVLVGIGNPKTSPTPYRSLAMGVPFLNPVSGPRVLDSWQAPVVDTLALTDFLSTRSTSTTPHSGCPSTTRCRPSPSHTCTTSTSRCMPSLSTPSARR